MATINVLPKEYQARRTFKGLLPEYYQKVIRSKPSPESDQYDFYFDDFRNGARVLCCTLLVVYEDATKEELVSVEQTYLLPVNPLMR